MARLSQLSPSIAGRVALITGAASGMGRATAELLVDEGVRVAVTDLEPESSALVVDRIRQSGGDAAGWPLDVSDPARIKKVVGEIHETLGAIDILANNAGIAIGGNLSQPDEEYEANGSRALDLMLTAQVRLAGAHGVTVNCICPGPILTEMTVGIPEEKRNKFARKKLPLRRDGEREEVAHATLNFALPAASYLNGVVLPVDGGMTIQNS